ncbi:MAG: alpha-xylosidase [Lachnospiraceae bacterium]|nr:alpha-xylosidase [Clostridium sp.]MDD6179046.1 alpha-xylosidase [Clostridium sp.]MDY4820849.1 alpha-xylosidase [Lachnospiraceae bacterium]
MLFGNGCWLQKEGCACFTPQEVYFENTEATKVTLCLPTSRIVNRGCTLGGINLTMVITSPAPDVLRVQTYHHLGVKKREPEFELYQKDEQPLTVTSDEEKLTVTSGGLTLEIGKKNWYMAYRRGNEVITRSAAKDLACMKTDWKGDAYDKGDGTETYMRQQLTMGVGELIYGLGERFTAFTKNGQSVAIWNEDGGTSTYQSYKNIPFYISNKGYGVFVNHPEKVEFEIGTEQVTKTAFSVEGGYLDYYLFNGPSMKEVLERYTDLTGKPSLPAPWTFGLWLSTSFTTNYDEETVMSFVDGMLDRGIPLRTFHFDCFWMKEFHWTDFVWDSRVFPEPKGMLSRIKAKGLNICVWINPYIAQESCLFAEGMEKGYFVKRTNGDVWQWDMWQPGMALVDFTNPDACTWYQEKLAGLLDMGVDCFKTDFGERIPVDGIEYFDHSDAKKMHNYYTYLYNKTVYDILEKKRGKGEAVLFARSATVGGQKFPVHWGGDCWSDYESMEESLRGGLSLLMSGFGFWAHDIGGFESTSTPDVYKRWVAFGLLSSHSRLHGSTSYRVPWAYDEEAVDVVRFFTRLKARLMPYLYKTAIQANKTGVPTMRSMVLEFTEDRTCHYVDKQYMLGDSLLVAPIFNEESLADYYLPAGRWTDFFTGEVKEGGRWIQEKHGYLSVPLLVKENSIVAIGAHDDKPDYDYGEDTELRIYEPAADTTVTETVYGMDGSEEIKISVTTEEGRISVSVDTGKTVSVRLVNRKAKAVENAEMQVTDKDTVLTKIAGKAVVTL